VGQPADNDYTSTAMQWGIDHEEDARTAVEFSRGGVTELAGFVTHPMIDGVGCSPDGYDGEGVLEIKCPYTLREHVRTLVTRQVPKQYWPQVQGEMWVCEKQRATFASFHPSFPERFRLVTVNVDRDQKYIDELETRVIAFQQMIADTIASLEGER
jgi:hypothetical protein